MPWRIAVFVPVILAVPTFVSIIFIHESPEWLLKKGRIEEYKRSMEFYQKDKVTFNILDTENYFAVLVPI